MKQNIEIFNQESILGCIIQVSVFYLERLINFKFRKKRLPFTQTARFNIVNSKFHHNPPITTITTTITIITNNQCHINNNTNKPIRNNSTANLATVIRPPAPFNNNTTRTIAHLRRPWTINRPPTTTFGTQPWRWQRPQSTRKCIHR